MTEIVLGMGTSHGPQLTIPPAQWELRVNADKQNPDHWFRGKKYNFAELVELRRGEGFGNSVTPKFMQDSYATCQRALAKLVQVYQQTKPDVAVIIGNDQFELFGDSLQPAFAVYWGDTIANIPKPPEMVAKLPPGIAPAELGYCPPQRADYSCAPQLGRHIIDSLISQGFDVAQSKTLPTGPQGHNGVPHAYGFIYRRIMGDAVIPHVPVLVNTHYPPNRPTARRCFEFGRAVARAIRAWPGKERIAVFGSGGFTHYVIDEGFDRMVLDAMVQKKPETICAIDEALFESGGTAEIKNWIPVFGAMTELGLAMTLVDYVPCYRSEAGTGNAMAFAYWN